MAHVLLPCDLPSWPEVQHHLSKLTSCKDLEQVSEIMADIYDICCISLDPEPVSPERAIFQDLERFLTDGLTEEEQCRFLKKILPDMAVLASKLGHLKSGFLYSLQQEEGAFFLDREMVASLLANAFFSTLPKRSPKTHPTLQDFSFANFFPLLHKRSHQKRLRAFLRYFENLEGRGVLKFSRKVSKGAPSLPSWLCSERPLIPLIIRTEGSVLDAEPHLLRVCSCSPLIGGDVLRTSTSKESKLFFLFPELLVMLCFVETLSDSEAFIVEGISQECLGFCFTNFTDSSHGQFEDQFLLKELNKALTAFPVLECLGDSQDISSLSKDSSSRSLSRESQGHSEEEPGRLGPMQRRNHFVRLPSSREEEYYTAEEDSEEGDDGMRSSSFSRSDSLGFVLGEESGAEEVSQHERLEDFRKRIRKRTRRKLSRRNSYLSSSGSSDMEDISEAPEERFIRPASSEPSLAAAMVAEDPHLSPAAAMRCRKPVMVTSSSGHLKAYSYDGVNPNLPVPFKAKFRLRKPQLQQSVAVQPWEEAECQLGMMVRWAAASMAGMQSCVLYTLRQPHLQEVSRVYAKVTSREWSVGDLSCELLRYCRLSTPHRKSQLFTQLLGE